MGEAGVSVDPDRRRAELERRVEELRRVNEQLGRQLGEVGAPRQLHSPLTAGRAVAKLTQERDAARADMEEAQRELSEAEAGLDHLRRENEQLRFEAARLRFGPLGFLRRGLARLLGR